MVSNVSQWRLISSHFSSPCCRLGATLACQNADIAMLQRAFAAIDAISHQPLPGCGLPTVPTPKSTWPSPGISIIVVPWCANFIGITKYGPVRWGHHTCWSDNMTSENTSQVLDPLQLLGRKREMMLILSGRLMHDKYCCIRSHSKHCMLSVSMS